MNDHRDNTNAVKLEEAQHHSSAIELNEEARSAESKEAATSGEHMEDVPANYVYTNVDEEPEFHARTYIALGCLFLLNYVQVFALQGPPAVLNWIGEDLDAAATQTWIPNAYTLVQAVLGPVIAPISDTFQARKTLLVGTCVVSFVGAAIAPGAQTVGRLIAAQVLIGFGFAAVPLGYCVPSEITPRRWRSMIQALLNIAALLAAISGPLTIGALTKSNPRDGWRKFYWIQFAIWGVTALGLFFGYRPPKRHTRLDHLSVWQKICQLDLPGNFLLTAGLTLFLVGLGLGGGLYSWENVRTLTTLVIGIVTLIAFGIWEWKGTSTGILHHELFRGGKNAGRTFGILLMLMFIEGILLFSFIIFYPVVTSTLFETDPFLQVARGQPYWIAACLSTVLWGLWSTKRRTIRAPLFTGFAIFTGGIVGFATLQPGDNFSQLAFAAVAGLGFGCPLVLIISGVQLSTPHALIATSTAVVASSRAISASVFTAIYAAALNDRLVINIPNTVAPAIAQAGLPASSIGPFIKALLAQDNAALAQVPGVTPAIIGAGVAALKQAFADSLRVIYIIAAPFGVVACVLCCFLGDMRQTMNYRVDAPMEDLHAKHHHGESN